MTLFLIGYMGCGKSMLGKALANRIGFGFVDLDREIERVAGRSVSEIFRDKGESAFRNLEMQQLRLDRGDDKVIATGGGCPIHHQNMDWILSKGKSVYLKISAEVAFQRLKDDRSHRPLLKGLSEDDLKALIKTQMLKREKVYGRADQTVNAENLSVEELAAAFQAK